MIVTTPPPDYPESSPGARAFGLTIRGRRIGAALTLRMCAELMGVSMTTLSHIEQGRADMTDEQRKVFESVIRSRRNPNEPSKVSQPAPNGTEVPQ